MFRSAIETAFIQRLSGGRTGRLFPDNTVPITAGMAMIHVSLLVIIINFIRPIYMSRWVTPIIKKRVDVG